MSTSGAVDHVAVVVAAADHNHNEHFEPIRRRRRAMIRRNLQIIMVNNPLQLKEKTMMVRYG